MEIISISGGKIQKIVRITGVFCFQILQQVKKQTVK